MNSVLPANEKIVYCSKRKKKRFCDHYDRLVSIRTFNAHKRRKTVDNAKIDYTDELLSQDLRIHSDSSDLDLDFDLSSDECSEVAKFAAESLELQGIYSYIYLHQTLMLFTFRINLL
ncbi:uncharacterized protein LOC113664840 [Pocillopora damicornis]|uniref:uncharacterized protein LOC113664840 n=1 Tax=Pocillopora damicornis TaxID=46731 RepID=UPI000F553E39|nr:uncharacterized protein LOC113664840 [Pocillopora damicornis]